MMNAAAMAELSNFHHSKGDLVDAIFLAMCQVYAEEQEVQNE